MENKFGEEQRLLRAIKNPYKIVVAVVRSSPAIYMHVSDKVFLDWLYRAVFGKRIDWENPQTFNEKLQWLKLNDRNPLYTLLVDKCEVKHYVADKIGAQYVIRTLGVWEHFDNIDFSALPNQFVLKCTHDSGGLVICQDKSKLDVIAAKEKLEKSLKTNFYWSSREWPYKNVKPRIIAEQYMVDESGYELKDYKFFVFNGRVELVFVATGRTTRKEPFFDFYNREFKYLKIKNEHPNAGPVVEKPENFEEMIALAEKLSEGIPHCRVDFYSICGKPYFGEMTFYHWSGFSHFEPEEWNLKLGSYIDLSFAKNR